MIKAINHIGIAVSDLDKSVELFKKLFQTEDVHKEIVEDQKVAVASFNIGGVLFELTQPTSPESPIAKHIEKKGEGIHHIAFEVSDIHEEMKRLQNEGFTLLSEQPKKGADNKLICFLHPKSSNGVLIELCQEIK